MAILDLASWAVFGAAVQGLAQGIRQKPLNYKPIGYVYSATLFVAVGLALDQVRTRQRSFLDRRVAVLAQERAARGVEFARQE